MDAIESAWLHESMEQGMAAAAQILSLQRESA